MIFPLTSALKISASSAALDLAHISQTSPRTHFAGRALEIRETSSEWPQFTGSPRGPEMLQSRPDRRTVTNPNLTLSAPSEDGAGKSPGNPSSATPLVQQQSHGSNHGQTPVSRRNSPPSLLDALSATTRSVPATPLGIPNNATHVLKSPGTPLTSDMQTFNGRIATPSSHQIGDSAVNASDLQASLSRLPPGAYDGSSLTFNSIQPAGREDVSCLLHFHDIFFNILFFQYGIDAVYGLNSGGENVGYNTYGFETGRSPANVNSPSANHSPGPAGLYQHNGGRYGLGLQGRGNSGPVDGKMNGLHGPKHKRGDLDRECKFGFHVVRRY